MLRQFSNICIKIESQQYVNVMVGCFRLHKTVQYIWRQEGLSTRCAAVWHLHVSMGHREQAISCLWM